jgi:hypothetical protein
MATSSHASKARRLRRAVLLAALLAAAAPAAGRADSYGWPLQPFDRQHPVRGFFGDPRVGEGADGHADSKTFHFGIDISAPDKTAVYATASGRIVWEPQRPETVAIRSADGTGRVFAYWHIVPSVRNGASAVAYRTVIGHIAAGWGHVHLAELVDGRYVNPLRSGALSPYTDTTRPRVHAVSFERMGKSLGPGSLSGRFDLVAETWDETPMLVPGRWGHKPVMPSLVRWRLVGRRGATTGWRTAIDFSATIPSPGLFDRFFAPWTRQNHPWRNGRYRVLLASGWDSSSLPDGLHRLEVEAMDTRGNRARRSVAFTLANRLGS